MSFLPPKYGYVFGVLGSSFVMNTYLTINVVLARKKYKVDYPLLYAPADNKHEKEFNSVQRAHQNTLESYGIVMLQMSLCGLLYPVISAVCGGIWVIGRVIYGYGYANDGPKGRMAGALISHIGDFPLIVLCFKIAYDLIVKDN